MCLNTEDCYYLELKKPQQTKFYSLSWKVKDPQAKSWSSINRSFKNYIIEKLCTETICFAHGTQAQVFILTLSFLLALNFFKQSTVSCLCIIEATVERCWKKKRIILRHPDSSLAVCLLYNTHITTHGPQLGPWISTLSDYPTVLILLSLFNMQSPLEKSWCGIYWEREKSPGSRNSQAASIFYWECKIHSSFGREPSRQRS